jgi:hypothetical protein
MRCNGMSRGYSATRRDTTTVCQSGKQMLRANGGLDMLALSNQQVGTMTLLREASVEGLARV